MPKKNNKNPFNEHTKIHKTFSILSDLKWHCAKHELPGSQPAKAIQIIRQHGFKIENKTILCIVCKDKTVHRRMMELEPNGLIFTRSQLPDKLKKKVKEFYHNIESVTLRNDFPVSMLEVDHRFPQVRWGDKEPENPVSMNDKEIQKRFMLLTRQNNLWKSRYCEKCFKIGERGTFPGINYFYEGDKYWNKKIDPHNPDGCKGCFWYDPEEWRKAINKVIAEL